MIFLSSRTGSIFRRRGVIGISPPLNMPYGMLADLSRQAMDRVSQQPFPAPVRRGQREQKENKSQPLGFGVE
jgi:hypothetical protein